MNCFFNKTDNQIIKMDNFSIPIEWWSRTFEYYFASTFLDENDICIDAGCGINHPFKDFASNRVKKLYAIDSNIEILNFKDTDKLIHKNLDLRNLSNDFEDNSIDKIFCISVLEHIKPQIPYILTEFNKVLKSNGLLILTFDYPTILPGEFIKMAYDAGFKPFGICDFVISDENIISSVYNLRCFKILLQKDNIERIEDIFDIEKKVKKSKQKKGGL